MSPVDRIKYDDAAIDAVQRLLETGKATVDGYGYLRRYPFVEGDEAIAALTAERDALAKRIERLEPAARTAAAWLKECHTWLLENNLDMGCPMRIDPLDIADDLSDALKEE